MKMSDTGDNNKYKWTPESTTLLVSVWTDRQVQKQLEYTIKPQLIWESIAKYMRKKGYEVTAKQCRSRMKQVLVCYREAKKTGTRAGVERYYESINKVLEEKRSGKFDSDTDKAGTDGYYDSIHKVFDEKRPGKFNGDADRNVENYNEGIDTVDSAQMNMKSPEKEAKTHVNFMMRRNKFEEPPEPMMKQVDIDHTRWQYIPQQEYYADSSESNETVLVRPHRSLSPSVTREPRCLSGDGKIFRGNMVKGARRSLLDDRYRYNTLESNRFSDIPLKNAVQNVQNQIIQENMLLRNQLSQDYIGNQMGYLQQPQNLDYCLNVGNISPNYIQDNIMYQQPPRMSTNLARIRSQLQQCALTERMDIHQPNQCQKNVPPSSNEEFYPAKLPKVHNLNETYDQDADMFPVNTTTITNNATFNDDTLSIEFMEDLQSPSDNGLVGSKAASPDPPPKAPVREKKAQKLEQLMINAITSQNEVVNKILAAQDSMVSRILDRDQDRQNRLENRLDQLMNVVHATVLNKSGSSPKESEATPPTLINSVPLCFSPPPKPGTVPPKLDLVPPKPCRVPCTSPSSNIELINQAPINTKPGVIKPTKPGSIWTKLGPVTASPFVQAQKEMNAGLIRGIANEWRTKSSAEKRIAMLSDGVTGKALINETERFLQSEKLMEERIENARQIQFDDANSLKKADQPARRQLFNPVESKEKPKIPSAEMILTSTFLDIERKFEEKSRYTPIYNYKNKISNDDELLNGQDEDFDHLRSLGEALGLNTSTPAKVEAKPREKEMEKIDMNDHVPRQTIQQLARLVMQSARWKNAPTREIQPIPPPPPPPSSLYENYAQRQGYNKAREWLKDRYSYGIEKQNYASSRMEKNYPMGFVNPKLNYPQDDNIIPRNGEPERFRGIGFNPEILTNHYQDNDFLEKERDQYNRRLHKDSQPRAKQREMIGNHGHNNYQEKETAKHNNNNVDSDAEDNDEYLDTTTTYRKTSLTSNGTSGTVGIKNGAACVVS